MATMSQIRKQRNMPFLKRGMRVYFIYDKKWGTISGANNSGNINVKFDGDNFSRNCHPHFEMKYYDNNGKLIAIYY